MNRHSRRAFAAVGAVLSLSALGACGAREVKEPAPGGVHVRVAAAALHDFTVRLDVSGRIVPPADRQASVSSPVSGRIQDVAAREGQVVRAGEVLARVDARPLEDAVRSAEAALKRAQADSEFKRSVARRSRELFDKGVTARQEAESDEAAAVAADSATVEAKASLSVAERNRSFAQVASPFDGVVVRVLKHPGEQVDGTPATAIVEVAGLHPLEVSVDVPAAALALVHAGDPAQVTIGGTSAGAPRAFAARVVRVAGALDAASLVGGVRLRFTASEPALALGTPVDVAFVVEQVKGSLSVPKRAVRRGPEGGAEVVLVIDKKTKAAPVETGPEDRGLIAIRSGLKVGDVVVVDDPLGLEDDVAVDASEAPKTVTTAVTAP
ncbi:MAG: efflux RND transporter periplasmic adaptor subunit [Thermoanaerobaculia bacterium]